MRMWYAQPSNRGGGRISMRAVSLIHAANYYRKRRNRARPGNWLPLLSLHIHVYISLAFRSLFGKFLSVARLPFSPNSPVVQSFFFEGEFTPHDSVPRYWLKIKSLAPTYVYSETTVGCINLRSVTRWVCCKFVERFRDFFFPFFVYEIVSGIPLRIFFSHTSKNSDAIERKLKRERLENRRIHAKIFQCLEKRIGSRIHGSPEDEWEMEVTRCPEMSDFKINFLDSSPRWQISFLRVKLTLFREKGNSRAYTKFLYE